MAIGTEWESIVRFSMWNVMISVTRDSSIEQLLLGALAFPYLAAGMGRLWAECFVWHLLSHGRPVLLRRVIVPAFYSIGGRSMIGGCLFVVMKNALSIYCRWCLMPN